jgi:hypothetical protein
MASSKVGLLRCGQHHDSDGSNSDFGDRDAYSDDCESVEEEEGGGVGSGRRPPPSAEELSSEEFSEGEAGSGTEVVYVREDVSVRPTAASRIEGRLSLVRQGAMLFIAWLPYRHGAGEAHPNLSTDRTLYAVHPIPLSDVRAVRRHTPPLRVHSVTFTLHSGISLPPFCFQAGGVKSFLAALRQHANLVRSADDPFVFLVNDLQDPLQRSLTSLQLADVLPPGRAAAGAPSWPLAQWQVEEEAGEAGEGAPLRAQLHDLVDRFQRFAAGARGAASSLLLAGSVMAGGGVGEELAALGRATVAAGGGDPGALEALGAGGAAGGAEGPPPQRAGAGEGSGGGADGGLAHSPSAASAGWELIERSASGDLAAPSWARPRPPPLSPEDLESLLDGEGRLLDGAALRARAFYGGVEPAARAECWKWLLGVHAAGSTRAGREAAAQARLSRYVELRRQWRTIDAGQAARFGKWRERQGRVDKDVRRTDRGHRFFARERGPAQRMLRNVLLTHVMYAFDLGYCQGMSDLASPILYVQRAAAPGRRLGEAAQTAVEAEAFWCFAALMERRAQYNFMADCA